MERSNTPETPPTYPRQVNLSLVANELILAGRSKPATAVSTSHSATERYFQVTRYL
jgi:hypothetical protein